ncbi:hypothetical protein [Candidatus Cetobacterium colombiensis]|uniref:Uncharacterized protein n=1 Tax=Candidatus Cetobacterium colombiensis TaxID=3073100 RepID=A0ABU4W9L8_9FUSO|nr:hypothetical protein [Candidatus Cetobacterium colombiensis]MDX8335110.1 hypothetical protein [Candidatus Cetobacterium colombiensis]
MDKVISAESINCLGTKDIQVEVTRDGFIVNIIALGEWYVEKAKDVDELEELLNEFNVQQYTINKIKQMVFGSTPKISEE